MSLTRKKQIPVEYSCIFQLGTLGVLSISTPPVTILLCTIQIKVLLKKLLLSLHCPYMNR